MLKRVLAVYYSQTGQLENLLNSIILPMEQSENIEIVWLRLKSTDDFSFPWSFWKFFDAFPESVYGEPPINEPFVIENIENFDLIVIGYQPWFLSPSLPMTAFMQSDEAKVVLANKPIVTVIGCRNMWIQAHKDMQKLIDDCGGTLIDNIVLSDQSGPLESFITTPRWMLTGKRESFLGLSSAGISAENIIKSSRFGQAIALGLIANKEKENISLCQNLGAVRVDRRFIVSEKIAKRSFLIWGRLIRLFGRRGSWRRRPILGFYIVFLITLIVTVVPLNMILQSFFGRLFKDKIDKIVKNIEAPSGR